MNQAILYILVTEEILKTWGGDKYFKWIQFSVFVPSVSCETIPCLEQNIKCSLVAQGLSL